MKRSNIKALKLLTADGTMLDFPDDILEPSQISKGVGPVRLDSGKVATGDWVMPDGQTITIDDKGYVKEVKKPTQASLLKAQALSIRAELASMRASMGLPAKPVVKQPAPVAKAIRRPFKAKKQPTGKRVPFHKDVAKSNKYQ